jgi:diacylglycerol kinase family enzyme
MRYLFLVNPKSGSRAGIKLLQVINNYFDSKDFSTFIINPITIKTITPQFINEFDTVVIAGGDGTFSLVADLLFSMNCQIPIATYPLGSGNDFCRTSGFIYLANFPITKPLVKKFIEDIEHGKVMNIDLWQTDVGFRFTNCVSFGMDALVAHRYNDARSNYRIFFHKMMSFNYYLIQGFLFSSQKIKPPVTISFIDSKNILQQLILDVPHTSLLITNLPSYAAGARICFDADPCDGLLEFTAIQKFSTFLQLMLTHWERKEIKQLHARFPYYQAKSIAITGLTQQNMQVDGEDRSDIGRNCFNLKITHAGTLPVIKLVKKERTLSSIISRQPDHQL